MTSPDCFTTHSVTSAEVLVCRCCRGICVLFLPWSILNVPEKVCWGPAHSLTLSDQVSVSARVVDLYNYLWACMQRDPEQVACFEERYHFKPNRRGDSLTLPELKSCFDCTLLQEINTSHQPSAVMFLALPTMCTWPAIRAGIQPLLGGLTTNTLHQHICHTSAIPSISLY